MKFNAGARGLFIVTAQNSESRSVKKLDEFRIRKKWAARGNCEHRAAKRFRKTHMGFICMFISLQLEGNNLFRLLIRPREQFKMFTLCMREIKYELKFSAFPYVYDGARRRWCWCYTMEHKKVWQFTLLLYNIFIFIFESSWGDNILHFIEVGETFSLMSLYKISFAISPSRASSK